MWCKLVFIEIMSRIEESQLILDELLEVYIEPNYDALYAEIFENYGNVIGGSASRVNPLVGSESDENEEDTVLSQMNCYDHDEDVEMVEEGK